MKINLWVFKPINKKGKTLVLTSLNWGDSVSEDTDNNIFKFALSRVGEILTYSKQEPSAYYEKIGDYCKDIIRSRDIEIPHISKDYSLIWKGNVKLKDMIYYC